MHIQRKLVLFLLVTVAGLIRPNKWQNQTEIRNRFEAIFNNAADVDQKIAFALRIFTNDLEESMDNNTAYKDPEEILRGISDRIREYTEIKNRRGAEKEAEDIISQNYR